MMVGRGHEVIVIGAPAMRAGCEAVGCSFVALSADFDEPPDVAVEDDDWVAYTRKITAPEIGEVLTAATADLHPDVLVIDCLLFNALSTAQALFRPVAMVVHFLAYDVMDDPGFWNEDLWRLNPSREALGLPALAPEGAVRALWVAPDVALVLPPRAWQPDDLPGNVRYVGPIANEPRGDAVWDLPWPPDDPRPLVVISMSSTYMHQESALERLGEAASRLEANVVLSRARAIPADAIAIPASVEVREWLNFEVVLPHAAVLATHGGQATVSFGLVHGVPSLVLPLGRDQSSVGEHLEGSSAGRLLAPDASVDEIHAALLELLRDERYRTGAEALGASMRALGNGRVAIEELERLARGCPSVDSDAGT